MSDMPSRKPIPSSPNTENLRRLVLVRAATITLQCVLVGFAVVVLKFTLPIAPLLLVSCLLMMFNGFTVLRLRHARHGWTVPNGEIALQLAVDITAHATWLFFLGGGTNPMVSWFLVPLAVAAAMLPSRLTWLLTLYTLTIYGLLLFYYMPVSGPVGAPERAFQFHTVGMWLSFVVAALIVAGLVARIGAQLRKRDRELALAREDDLRNEQLMGVAILAAGVAHRLATPLNTMTLLVEEMQSEVGEAGPLSQDLNLLHKQLAGCKQILGLLRAQADSPKPCPVTQAIPALLDDWQLLRPNARPILRVLGIDAAPMCVWDFSLRQAMLNLLDNAADAAEGQSVEIEVDWRGDRLILAILDRGPGFDGRAARHADGAFMTSKAKLGMGVGIHLANASIEKAKGSLRWLQRAGGGTRTEIVLPLVGKAVKYSGA
ncbi:sensor histidine kinase [Parachitinimonas caeni]|uniref:histidine kinase n=1 Tax=Parachitinimonas caeni TaxID=3031301 RepID=A0ABT7E0W0_9NEIS|nr:HAMP domain-containing sensor histidine kinase [Parachitinimonas caeni]MDK2125960.1 HAMP domain-containing sensor histidine kinase [Parachitinimonas caeni]